MSYQGPEIRANSAAPGLRVGSYVLERRLGAGAMGEVWLGTHVVSHGRGAVKLIRADSPDRATLLRYFNREALAVSRLRHPHVVAVFEIGATHIVYQYIDGQDLARRMRTPIDPAMAVRIIRQIASALAHAHERDLVHRDVKPANVLLDKFGNAYLADFGLATVNEELPEASAGTPAYAAPEQWMHGKVTGAADQYALARTLCEMLAGTSLPNDVAKNIAVLPDHLPPLLIDALQRALARNSVDRFPSMVAFDEALAKVDVSAHPVPVHLAPEVHPQFAYAFWMRPITSEMVSPEIVRASYRLTQLGAENQLPPNGVAQFLEETGLAEFGFSLYASIARLGPISDPLCLTRATEVVILVHGWGTTRQTWEHVATAICRDNAQAIVLLPDVWGFGESTYSNAPTAEQVGVMSLSPLLRKWMTLLGLNNWPTVILGHSVSATALLLSHDNEIGAATQRVAMSPILPAYSEEYRRRLNRGIQLSGTIGRIPAVHQWLVKRLASEAPTVQELRQDIRENMAAIALAVPSAHFRTLFRSILSSKRFHSDAQRRLTLFFGENDPLVSEAALADAIRDLGLSGGQVVRLATGGHCPHLESEAHPEWTARNIAEIVYLIGQMLLASSQVEHPSMVHAATSLGHEQQDVTTESTIIA